MLTVQLAGGGRGDIANVTPSGEFVVAPLAYDETEFNELGTINTAFNFYGPKANKQFVLTGLLAYGDKQVNSASNATVVVYEAASIDTTTVAKVLIQFEIGQNQSLPLSGLHLLVNSGVWVNGKTDDDDVHMTLMGYYISKLV